MPVAVVVAEKVVGEAAGAIVGVAAAPGDSGNRSSSLSNSINAR